MSISSLIKRVIWVTAFAATVTLSSTAVMPAAAQSGGIAISGSFQNHHYRMVPGTTLENPEMYVVVFNRENVPVRIKLTPLAPNGVQIRLSQSDFTISAGKEQTVQVGVSVGPQAVPGIYTLAITAEIQRAQGPGIMVMGAVQQQTKLTIMGEAGNIHIRTVDLFGKPVNADLQVCIKEDKNVPCFISSNGVVEAMAASGIYTVHAFINGVEIAMREFSLAANQTADITLVAQTVFIRGFSVAPNFHTQTGDIAFANVVYTLDNIYQAMPNSKATLMVLFNGKKIDEEQLISLPQLGKGSTDGSYKYVPTQGWKNGTYVFSMGLFSQGTLAAEIPERKLEVTRAPPETAPNLMNRLFILGIVTVILVVIIIFLFLRRLRVRD